MVYDDGSELIETWEKIGRGLYRLAVIGGWIISSSSDDSGICFVPDPEHLWNITKEYRR